MPPLFLVAPSKLSFFLSHYHRHFEPILSGVRLVRNEQLLMRRNEEEPKTNEKKVSVRSSPYFETCVYSTYIYSEYYYIHYTLVSVPARPQKHVTRADERVLWKLRPQECRDLLCRSLRELLLRRPGHTGRIQVLYIHVYKTYLIKRPDLERC